MSHFFLLIFSWLSPKRLAVLSKLLVALIVVPHCAWGNERSDGTAYARKTGRVSYRETHWVYQQGGVERRLVLYRCANGEPFARKTVLERPSAIAPDFDFVDGRDGYREGVRTRDGKREMYVRKRTSAALESRPLVGKAGAVIDVGFDAFVRSHWEAFSRRSSVTAPFLLPSRFRYLDFKISRIGDTVLDGQPARQLRMASSAWYGFAIPAIELTYSSDGRRLLEFRGLGTVRDKAGRHEDVRIVFRALRHKASATRAEIDRAASLPLTNRCGG